MADLDHLLNDLKKTTGAPAAAQQPFTRPPLKNVGDILDFQRASVMEKRFHGGSSDKNMELWRKSVGIDKFYNEEGHATGIKPVDAFLTHAGRGTIDLFQQYVEDPLTYETLGIGGVMKPVAMKLLRSLEPVLGPMVRAGIKITPKIFKEAASGTRTVANAVGHTWHDLTHYAPKAKREVGVPKTQQVIAAASKQAVMEPQALRVLTKHHENAMAGLSAPEREQVMQLLNGQISWAKASPKVAVAARLRQQLDRVGVAAQAAPGGGARAAVADWGTRAVGTKAPKVTVQAAPRPVNLTDKEARQHFFGALKRAVPENKTARRRLGFETLGKLDFKGTTQEDYLKGLKSLGGSLPQQNMTGLFNKRYLPAEAVRPEPTQASSIDDWAASLRDMGKQDFRHTKPAPGKLLTDVGVPILKQPALVKGPFGKLQRAPTLDSRFKPVAMGEFKVPELPPDMREFASGTGEFTASNVKRKYAASPRKVPELDPNRVAGTINLLEKHNPHLKSAQPFTISPGEGPKFEAAHQAMIASTARHLTTNQLKVDLAKIFGMKPQEVAERLPESVQSILTRPYAGKGTGRTPGEIVSHFAKAGIGGPKTAVSGFGPYHMFNIADFTMLQAPEILPEVMKNVALIASSRDNPAKRWAYFGKEAAKYGIGMSRESKGLLTAHVPGVKQMSDATWLFDVASVLPLAKKFERELKISPLEAGQKAREALVDYEHSSRAQMFAKYIAPFAQFATGSIKAVTRPLIKRPRQIEALNRMSGGKMLGGGDQDTGIYYGPSAKVGRIFNIDALPTWMGGLADDPRGSFPGVQSYVKSTLAQPYRMAGSLLGAKNLTDFKDPLSKEYLQKAAIDMSPIPMGRTIMNQTGLSGYDPSSAASEAIFSSSGFNPGKNFLGDIQPLDALRKRFKQSPPKPVVAPKKKTGDHLDDLLQGLQK